MLWRAPLGGSVILAHRMGTAAHPPPPDVASLGQMALNVFRVSSNQPLWPPLA